MAWLKVPAECEHRRPGESAFGLPCVSIAKSARANTPPPAGDRPELLDAVGADADIPVVEVGGGVTVAGDQADLVADPEPVGGGRNGKAAVLVGGAFDPALVESGRLGRRSGPSERTRNPARRIDQCAFEQPLPPLRARPLVRARCEGPVAGRSPTGALYR